MKTMKVRRPTLFGVLAALVVMGAIIGGNLWASQEAKGTPSFIYQAEKAQVSGADIDRADDAIVLARRGDITLFRKPTGIHSADLWLFDKTKNSQRRILRNVLEADLSPSAKEAVVTTDAFELLRIRLDGRVIEHIEEHGASPVYSPDGKHLAFIKLNDGDLDALAGDPSFVTGVAIYDFAKATSSLIVEANGLDLFGIASWTSDRSRLYYLSSDNPLAPDTGATWSVKTDGTDVRQETNRRPSESGIVPTPYFTKRHLWLDEQRAISESDGEIWLFHFDDYGFITASSKVDDGDQLQWIDDRGIFAYRKSGENGKATWITSNGKEF